MRALFVVPAPRFDGGARALVDGGVALVARGHSALMATAAGGDVERVARALGLETVAVAEVANPYRRSRELKRILAAQHPDLIAVTSESDLLGAAWAVRRENRPVLMRRVATEEAFERHWRARLAERRAARSTPSLYRGCYA